MSNVFLILILSIITLLALVIIIQKDKIKVIDYIFHTFIPMTLVVGFGIAWGWHSALGAFLGHMIGELIEAIVSRNIK